MAYSPDIQSYAFSCIVLIGGLIGYMKAGQPS